MESVTAFPGHSLPPGYKDDVKAIRVSQPGAPDALQLAEVDVPKPKRGEVVVRIEAIGVNFIDVYHRTGLYKLPSLQKSLYPSRRQSTRASQPRRCCRG